MTSPRSPDEPAFSSPAPRASVLRLMFRQRNARAALKVSLVVGTVLNFINNGEQFWAHHPVSFWQVAMNYLVPYCVSSYSAARNEAQRGRGS